MQSGETRITIELDPPELGVVNVVLTSTADGLSLTLTAERPDTRALLLHSLPELQGALASQGVAPAAVAVATTPPPSPRQARQERREPGRRPPAHGESRQPRPSPGTQLGVGTVNFTA